MQTEGDSVISFVMALLKGQARAEFKVDACSTQQSKYWLPPWTSKMSGVSQASGTTLVSNLEKGGYMQKPKSIYPYSSALELKGQDPWLSAFSLVTTGLGHKRTWSEWSAIDSFLLSSTHCWVLHLKTSRDGDEAIERMSSFHLSLNPYTLCISIFCLYLCLWPLTPANSP